MIAVGPLAALALLIVGLVLGGYAHAAGVRPLIHMPVEICALQLLTPIGAVSAGHDLRHPSGGQARFGAYAGVVITAGLLVLQPHHQSGTDTSVFLVLGIAGLLTVIVVDVLAGAAARMTPGRGRR